MTGFYPPKPIPQKTKLGPFKRFQQGRYSLLNVLYEKTYSMKLGKVWSPRGKVYFAVEPSLTEEILKDPIRFPKSDLASSVLDQLLGQSIFVTNGEKWRKQRHMMAPSFEHAGIHNAFAAMVDATQAMIERLRAEATGSPFLVDHEMTHVTADIIFRTIYSRPMTRENSVIIFDAFNAYQELAYAHSVWKMAGCPEALSPPRHRAKKYARIVRGLLEEYVRDRLKNNEGQQDILQSLMEAKDPETGKGFTESELVDQVGIMFLAGHETTASALSWSLYLISHVPEVANKIQAEGDAFWSEGAQFKNQKLLKFTRDVFREAMRLYPPVAMLPKDTVQIEKMRDKLIRKGALLFVSPWLSHRQKKAWKDPDMFKPERFSDPKESQVIRDRYMPFSKGPRVCLGASFALQEAVLILSAILHNFDIEKDMNHVPEPVARLTLRPINGISIKLKPRTTRDSGTKNPH